ncbi:MAG: dipeptide epimerase [Saprospiraceae bacterium]|nr:dipeptide epimerase [Saprospiraceae bacterium]
MNGLKIDRIEIYPTRIKLIEPFVISVGAITHARNTVVKIILTDGRYGIGECCPYRSIHGETMEGQMAIAQDIAKNLIGLDPRTSKRHLHMMNKVMKNNASIKAAFDMALYDLNAKIAELPLYIFLGGDNKKEIFTDNTVSLLEADKMVDKALQFKDLGFPVLKVKLGEQPSKKDVERITSIRKAVGDTLPLRVDANQGWNFYDAKYALNAMKDLNIEHCEEPIAAANIRDQKRLTEWSTIPIMADEAVFNHHDAYRILAENAADLINIKLGKTGGIENAMKVASICEAAGVYCQVGSFSESRLGISALVHFDLAWDNIIYHDLDSPLMMSEDPIIGGLSYSDKWQVTVDDSPGHGADYDPSFLKMFECVAVK